MIMQQQIPLLLAFLLFVLAVLRLRKKSKGHDSSCKPPPGPRGLPIIGNIHQLAASVTVPHRLCAHWAKKYGPIMQLKIGEVNTVIISSPEVAKDVFNDINFAERPDLLVSQIMLYNGQGLTFAQYGDHWRQMRKICVLELFSAKRVRSFKSVREEEVSNLIRSIRSKAGSPIDIRKMLLDLSNVITSRSSIGTKYKNQAALLHVVEQVTRAVAGINVVDIFPSSRLLRMISQFRSSLRTLQEEADQMLQDIINERRAQRVEKKTGENEEEDNILDVLLNLQDDRSFEISTDSIKSIILEIYTGGSETSTTVLEWIISELMKNPSVMEKAQKEVRQVFNSFENVDETIVDNLNFMKLVIKESLRLHPPGAFIPRACSKTCQVNGYTIEAKTKVMVNAWAIGRDPKYWTEPEKFYPERFLHSSVDYKGANFELVPFGAGRRMCPGMLFGMATVEFTLAQLLYHFDWKLANGATPEAFDMQEIFASTMRRKHDLIVVPIPRRP
ncbi:cytochrome P450 726A27 [Populus alba]|uniref:Cytochrome P450 71D10-like n=2 Tax=Populus TaxID=3689 RepID=A0AAD6LZX7_9ROSI|nr:cytochrome P450 71D10-like [Populus alba]KAJ6976216.1 cytochrome P450 71D10-like [Populus alba x Populus x berolinensis]